MAGTRTPSAGPLRPPAELADLIAVLDVVPEPVVLTARGSGLVTYENPASITLFGSIAGHTIEALIPPDRRDRHVTLRESHDQRPLSRPLATRPDLQALTATGERIPVRVSLTALPDRLEGDLGIIVDLRRPDALDTSTRRIAALERAVQRELEAIGQLQHASAAAGRLISTAAHELRTPVTLISGALETLTGTDGRLSPEDRDQVWRTLLGGTSRMRTIVDDLTSLSDARGGQLSAHASAVPLQQHVTRAVQQRGRTQVEVACGDAVATVDPLHLERVLDNLLDNAALHAPGPVRVSASGTDTLVLLHVDDAGGGVPEALRDAIFEPFQRRHLPTALDPGMGIGLALCRALLGLSGATVHVTDRPDGAAGARFTITMPRATDGP